jgi:hypothetical protein
MIETARFHLNHHLARLRLRIRQIAQLKFSGVALSNESNGFHAEKLTQSKDTAKRHHASKKSSVVG